MGHISEKNGGRKSTLTERDRRTLRKTVSKNHRTTAVQVTVELNTHLEIPLFPQKTVLRELHESNVHVRAGIAKPLITEINAQIRPRHSSGG
jgi:hypothetical protein